MSSNRTNNPPARPSRITSARDLAWRKSALHLRERGPALVTVVPDDVYPGMWRVRRPDGTLSDLVNLARAKDAAVSLALGILDRKKHSEETPSEAPPARQKHEPYVPAAPDLESFWRAAQ
jgi:hypothetical protein